MDMQSTLFVPGLGATARLYSPQIGPLWQRGPVMVANHTRHDSMAALAKDILAYAPPEFTLIGLSMGGYIAFEIMRQAPERVRKLVLLDTSARADTPEQTDRRRISIAKAEAGDLTGIAGLMFPVLVHVDHRTDASLKAAVEEMLIETGAEAFIRQQIAIMDRPDSRPGLSAICCPTLVMVGDGDELTPPPLAEEIAQGIQCAQLVTVPASGHLSTLENPGFVTQTLLEWLRRH